MNNLVFFNGKFSEGAIVSGKLKIQFEKTEYDNPFVNGIVLYEGSLEDTDFPDIAKNKATWDKAEQEEKKKTA